MLPRLVISLSNFCDAAAVLPQPISLALLLIVIGQWQRIENRIVIQTMVSGLYMLRKNEFLIERKEATTS